VDLLGPWTVQVRGTPHTFDALTVIDTVTNLVELVRVDCKNSDHIMRNFAQCWLTRYPWPQCCIHDPGGEFTGPKFQTLLQNCHVRDVVRQQRIHSLMLCANKCIKQSETF
jgi:hypothetical protein